MDEKLRLIDEYVRDEDSMRELCGPAAPGSTRPRVCRSPGVQGKIQAVGWSRSQWVAAGIPSGYNIWYVLYPPERFRAR